jgi:hypothetical protein
MKWHAQVLHVARKDLRLSRWLLLAYAAVVAGAAAGAAEWGAFAAIDPALRTLTVFMLGAVLFAALVQADSPARGDSLWVTLPLQPSAVFAAKLLVGGVVLIGIPVLGQLVGLRAHAVAWDDLPGLLAQSAVSYGVWLAIVAAIAGLTRDLRSFLLALTLLTFGWLFAVRAVALAIGLSGPSRWDTSPFIVAGMLLLLAHQYRTRDVRRGAAMGVFLGIAVVFVPLALPRSAASAIPATGTIPEHLRPASIEIGEVSLKPGSEATFVIRVVGVSPFHHYVLVSPTVRVRMADGSSSAVRPGTEGRVSLNDPAVRLEGLRSLTEHLRSESIAAQLQIELSPAQRQALADGQARLSLQGRLQVREIRAGVELPLRAGAGAADGGRRIRITSVEILPEGPAVEVRTSEVRSRAVGDPDGRGYGREPAEYLLLNRSRRESLQMGMRSSSGSDFALVLPGPHARSATTEMLPDDSRPDGEPRRVGADWLSGARLLLVRWVPVGSTPIAAEDRGRGYKEWTAEFAPRGRGR